MGETYLRRSDVESLSATEGLMPAPWPVISYYIKEWQMFGLRPPSPYDGRMGPHLLHESARAAIDERKLSGYLLKKDHPGNGGKAAFFLSLGYGQAQVADLRKALLSVAAYGQVVRQVDGVYGSKLVVDGLLWPKSGGVPRRVRTVWIVASAGDAPRFVSA